jgi:hypothetical protein
MNKRELKFWRKVLVGNDCWEWTGGKKEDGYGRFYEGMFNKKRTYAKAHRAAWEMTNGPIPKGGAVRHTCDDLLCVRPSHLIVDVQLTPSNVVEIKKALESPYHSCTRLAEQWSVSLNTIYDIRKGRTWKNI